jgi:hypothetical protein
MADAREVTDQTPRITRWLAIGGVALAVAAGAWLGVTRSADDTQVMRESGGAAAPAPAATEPEPVPAHRARIDSPPDHHIAEGGRLSLGATSLPEDGVVMFGLALGKAALGEGGEPLSAVIVSASDGRRLELSATPVAGALPGMESGVRLDVETTWLTPGLYMIQLRTREKSALAVRRYVLEVKGEG